MRRFLLVLLFIVSSVYTYAQEFSTVPGTYAKQLPNGWHKFESEGAILDVEVLQGFIIEGNIKWFNNDTYSGTMGDSNLTGKGTYTWSNGERYEGALRSNKRHGKGTMHYENGDTYGGKWKNDKPHGKGILTKADGTVEVGVWDAGVMVKKK